MPKVEPAAQLRMITHMNSLFLSSCRRTAGLSQSPNMVHGGGMCHHGTWCQVSKRGFQSLPVPELSLSLAGTCDRRCLGITASSPTEPWTAWLTWVLAFDIFHFFWYFPEGFFWGGKGQAFAMQSCARCGFVVYPAEKINCIDQVTQLYCDH